MNLALLINLTKFYCRFWNYLIEFCPLWVHPNLLSVIGLIINLVTVIVLAIYSSNEQVKFFFRLNDILNHINQNF